MQGSLVTKILNMIFLDIPCSLNYSQVARNGTYFYPVVVEEGRQKKIRNGV